MQDVDTLCDLHCSPTQHLRTTKARTFQQQERRKKKSMRVVVVVGCFMSQQHVSVSQGQICSDKFTRCHIEIEFADQTFYLPQPQYTDTGPTSPSTDPVTPSVWQGNQWSTNFSVTGMTRPRKIPMQAGIGRLNH